MVRFHLRHFKAWAISFTPLCPCLLEETLKAVGPNSCVSSRLGCLEYNYLRLETNTRMRCAYVHTGAALFEATLAWPSEQVDLVLDAAKNRCRYDFADTVEKCNRPEVRQRSELFLWFWQWHQDASAHCI